MDTLRLASLLISLVIFALALYEALSLVQIIGKMPRFWIFFIAAITLVIVNRLLQILSTPIASSEVDADIVPVLFSALLLLWIYDMKQSFKRAAPRSNPELTAPEKS